MGSPAEAFVEHAEAFAEYFCERSEDHRTYYDTCCSGGAEGFLRSVVTIWLDWALRGFLPYDPLNEEQDMLTHAFDDFLLSFFEKRRVRTILPFEEARNGWELP